MLGTPVVYHVPEEHLTKTTKSHVGENPVELAGSVHHPEQSDFAGQITAVHEGAKPDDDTFDLIIFPPGRAPVHVAGVTEGADHGQFEIVEL